MNVYMVLRCWDNGEQWEDYEGDDWQYIAIKTTFDAAVNDIKTKYGKDAIDFEGVSKYTVLSKEKYEKMHIDNPGELIYGAEWYQSYHDYYGNNHMRYYILKVPFAIERSDNDEK